MSADYTDVDIERLVNEPGALKRLIAETVALSGETVDSVERRLEESLEAAGLERGGDGRIVSKDGGQLDETGVHSADQQQLRLQQETDLRIALDDLGVRLGLRFRVLFDREGGPADPEDGVRGVVLVHATSVEEDARAGVAA